MDTSHLFSTALQLQSPWKVGSVDFRDADGGRQAWAVEMARHLTITHHKQRIAVIIYVFQPNLSPVLTFYNQNKVHWATFSNFGV